MDRREGVDQFTYKKELERELADEKEYDDLVDENGVKFRVPYQNVKEVVFTGLNKEQLIDTEHSARLQYRLMLLEAVLFAKVEFVTRKISITYNPESAVNRKEKMSLQQIVDFLAKEGVAIAPAEMKERDVDYYKEHYSYHYNPPSIREHPPYGYTLEEWRKMKAEYTEKKAIFEQNKQVKYHNFQMNYLREHPELAEKLGVKIEPEKPKTLLQKIFNKKKENKGEKEKGFWFHGV